MSSAKSSIAVFGKYPISLASIDWFEFNAGNHRYAIFASDIGRDRGALMEIDEQPICIAAIHPITIDAQHGRDAILDSERIRKIMTRAMHEDHALKELIVLLSSRDAA